MFEKHATTTAGLVLISLVQFGFRSFFGPMDQTFKHYFYPFFARYLHRQVHRIIVHLSYSGSQDCSIHNPPEILTLEPKLHLVYPDVVIGPIEDGDYNFNIVGGGERHFVDRFPKRSPSARDLFLKKKLKEDQPYDAFSDIDSHLIPGCF